MHNREFISILPDRFSDWMLTGVFYAAVHAVESLIAFDGLPNHTSHEARNQTLRTVRRYQQVWRHYRELYDASQTTRYDCDPNLWIPSADVKAVWIPQYLYPLEQSVRKLIGDTSEWKKIEWRTTIPATPSPSSEHKGSPPTDVPH
jgi:hypothetical protein